MLRLPCEAPFAIPVGLPQDSRIRTLIALTTNMLRLPCGHVCKPTLGLETSTGHPSCSPQHVRLCNQRSLDRTQRMCLMPVVATLRSPITTAHSCQQHHHTHPRPSTTPARLSWPHPTLCCFPPRRIQCVPCTLRRGRESVGTRDSEVSGEC